MANVRNFFLRGHKSWGVFDIFAIYFAFAVFISVCSLSPFALLFE